MPPQEKAPVTQDNEKSLENNNACDMELVPTNNGYTNEGFVKECNTNDDQKRPNDEEKKMKRSNLTTYCHILANLEFIRKFYSY